MFCSCIFFCFKQKTAYDMRISVWSSDVCSSDLSAVPATTALRWIKTFEDLQLISRRADPSDGRRIFIQLVSKTKRQMDELIEEIGRASCRERVCQYV